MATKSKLDIVVFPWVAFGHMIPFLHLAKHIAQKGHKISFISTPKSIQRLPKLPLSLSSNINFVELNRHRIENLTENAESTMDVPASDAYLLKDAFDGLEAQLTMFLESTHAEWIICDFAPYWLPPNARRLNIKCALLFVMSAWFMNFCGPADAMIENPGQVKDVKDYLVPPGWIPFPSNLAFRKYQVKKNCETSGKFSRVKDVYRLGMVIKGCDLLTLRYCSEFEPVWLELIEKLQQKPAVPLGFMPPLIQESEPAEENDGETNWDFVKAWFDQQNKGSVVYVALGSEAALSQDQLSELALGLELSRLPFFWVLRKPPGSGQADPAELPDGFEERTKCQGVVWKSWAPQVKILSHESVGGFLTHCGWSSVIEGLAFGRAFIMLPIAVDQGLIARVLVEKRVGVEIPRDENDGTFTRNSVAESLITVMVSEDGKLYKDTALEMSEIFGNKELNKRYVYNFIEYLESHV